MKSLMQTFFDDTVLKNTPKFSFPKYNMYKRGNTVFVEFALAGYKKEELKVKQVDNLLEVEGVPEVANPMTDMINFWSGIAHRPFKVEITLPRGAEVGAVRFENGLLQMSYDMAGNFNTRLLEIK